MRIGIGTDIEKVSRFESNLNNKSFLNKIFTQNELDYCLKKPKPAEHLTARFAGKEATIKAYYSLFDEFINYQEIEITNDKNGKPILHLNKNVECEISLSHTSDNAVAFVHLEKDE
tara:strand:+ start:2753 stop:3100 length:348 start_codon:yes stop_codon:yes gene_type:complete